MNGRNSVFHFKWEREVVGGITRAVYAYFVMAARTRERATQGRKVVGLMNNAEGTTNHSYFYELQQPCVFCYPKYTRSARHDFLDLLGTGLHAATERGNA